MLLCGWWWCEQGSVGVGEDVDSSADWLVVFDTEFSQQGLGLKVRTTSQIPVSGTTNTTTTARPACLPAQSPTTPQEEAEHREESKGPDGWCVWWW